MKTSATTGAELEAAAAARAAQDAAAFKRLADEAVAAQRTKAMDTGKRQLSSNPDAVRKRREYEKKKKVAKPIAKREKSIADAAKAVVQSG